MKDANSYQIPAARINIANSAYERSLRLGATGTLALTFAILLTLFVGGFSYYILTGTSTFSNVLTDGTLCFSVILFLLSVLFARQHHLHLATSSTVAATNLTIITFMTFWAFSAHHYFDAITLIQFGSLDIAIMLTGALGAWWLVVATTLIVNIYSFWLVAAIGQLTTLPSTIGFLLLILILQQWTVAALALTITGVYRRILGDLGQAYEQAQQLDQLKDQFITHVNHELRTPIMALHGYVEFLQMTYATLTPDEAYSALKKANKSGYNLINLLNSILDVRRIDASQETMSNEAVPVLAVLQESIELIYPGENPTDQPAIRITIGDDLAMVGDRVRIQQILTNLISNAHKYAPGSPIDISAKTEQIQLWQRHKLFPWQVKSSTKSFITLYVQDHGPGIPREQIPLLFNRFVRLPRDLASRVIGNGLGLYLCRMFAISMGGKIWAESTGIDGEGTCFILQLPAVEQNP